MSAVSYFLYLVGALYNDLARCSGTNLPAMSSENALYPVDGLFDGDPSNPAMFADASANPTITIDKNIIPNGDMVINDGGSKLLFWNEDDTGTGHVDYDATAGPTGGPAAKLVTGTGTAAIYRDYDPIALSGGPRCKPGEFVVIVGSLKSDGTHAVKIQLQSLLDLTYVNGAGIFQTAAADIFSSTSASWVDFVLALRIPSFAALGWPLVGYDDLRVKIHCDDAGVTAYATDVFMWPASSLWSFHGYDQQPQLAVELYRGGTGLTPSYSLLHTLTPVRPAFYYALNTNTAPLQDRFWKVKLAGMPSSPPWFGLFVMGQYEVLTTGFQFGGKVTRLFDQVRTQAAFGPERARAVAQIERRKWSAKFSDLSQAAFDQFLEQVARRGGYGTFSPIVIVPEDDAPTVIHGAAPAILDPTRRAWNVHDRELVIPEDPFPSFSA